MEPRKVLWAEVRCDGQSDFTMSALAALGGKRLKG